MKKELIIVSGPSGSGISSTKYVFEELNYFIIDNLPSSVIDAVLEDFLSDKYVSGKFALLVNLFDVKKILKKAKANKNFKTSFILLNTDKQELLKRYALTRHSHPLSIASNINLEQAIEEELKQNKPLFEQADLVVDTTSLTVRNLRDELTLYLTHSSSKDVLNVNFMSFGIKNGMPSGIDMMFDVRTIPNPYWVEELKPLTGYDQKVIDYMNSFPITQKLIDNIVNYLTLHLKEINNSSRFSYTIGIACSGGQHRSTYVAKYLADHFSKDYKTTVIHRDSPSLNK